MRIAISGLSGCGSTTACTNVGKALGLKVVNYTFRNLAAANFLHLSEIQRLATRNREVDYLTDQQLIRLAQKEKNCVVGSRLAGWLIDADLSVWLEAPLETRAGRIAHREKLPFAAVKRATAKRDADNISRYKKVYGIDTLDHSDFDIVVNTSRLSARQVAELIVTAAKWAAANRERPANLHAQRIKAIISQKLKGNKLKKLGLQL